MLTEVRTIRTLLYEDEVEQVRKNGTLRFDKRGNHLRPCWFHVEKTPSLVLRSNHSFHCFGCGTSGKWDFGETRSTIEYSAYSTDEETEKGC